MLAETGQKTISEDQVKDIIGYGDRMFSKKSRLDSLWQTIAEQFYPERADFTTTLQDGEEFGRHLTESIPVQYRRELGNAIGVLQRPPKTKWFQPRSHDEWRNTDRAKAYLDEQGDVMRSYMYSEGTNFTRAYGEGDHDVATFGNAVQSMTENRDRDGVVFHCHHLRDCAWAHDEAKNVNVLHRKLKITLANLKEMFGADALTEDQIKQLEKDPQEEIEIRHVCMPTWHYDRKRVLQITKKGFKFTGVYINPAAKKIVRENGYHEFPYLVRRWNLIGNSPYALSPATSTGLCDARMLQVQAAVILDAGELAVNPALLASQDAVIGNMVANYAGAITWVSGDYDQKLGQAVQPLNTGGNIQLGLDMKQDSREVLAAAMYVNKLSLPGNKDMTKYEASERIEEYARSLRAVIDPQQVDHSELLDRVHSFLMRITMRIETSGGMGPFSPLMNTPAELQDSDIEFEFDGPLQMAMREQDSTAAQKVVMQAGEAAKVLGPEILDNLDGDTLVRDASVGAGGKHKWLRSVEKVQAKRDERAQQQQQQQAMEKLAQGAAVAGQAAGAVPALAQAAQHAPGLMDLLGGGNATGA
jgi:Bacteriophage head to tail connecting protein